MLDVFSLQGKTVLITGGASGLGYAMAKCCASAGARIIITGTRNEVALSEACREIGKDVYFEQFDITNLAGMNQFVDKLLARFGTIDVLINNAGVHCKKPFEQVCDDDLNKVLDVHLRGAFAITRTFIPHFKEKQNGNIIFISSMSAFLEMTEVTAYASAKAAVLGLMRSLSGELAEFGIRVNAIVPGFIETPMFRKVVDADPARQKKILDHTPMKRFGSAEDVGWACVYLISDASVFITGVALPVDGGCRDGF